MRQVPTPFRPRERKPGRLDRLATGRFQRPGNVCGNFCGYGEVLFGGTNRGLNSSCECQKSLMFGFSLYSGTVSTPESQKYEIQVINYQGSGSSRMNNSDAIARRRVRFDRVVGSFHKDMFRYAAWLSRDRGIAEDVAQEALLRAWKSLDSLRDDDAAKQWLLMIVRRENARYFERKRLETVDIDNLTGPQSAMLAETDDSDLDDMREAIYKLDDDYREPLVLQVLFGHSTSEIAALMGINPGAVLTRLHRARLKLKDIVDEVSHGM